MGVWWYLQILSFSPTWVLLSTKARAQRAAAPAQLLDGWTCRSTLSTQAISSHIWADELEWVTMVKHVKICQYLYIYNIYRKYINEILQYGTPHHWPHVRLCTPQGPAHHVPLPHPGPAATWQQAGIGWSVGPEAEPWTLKHPRSQRTCPTPKTNEAEEAESYMWIPVWIMRTLQFSQCCQDADRHAAFLGLAPRQEPNSKSGLTWGQEEK